jgi:hypothetical protein
MTQQLLEDILTRAKALRRTLKSEPALRVAKVALRNEARELGKLWHTEAIPFVKHAITPDILNSYNESFGRLIRLSSPNNRVPSYLAALETIIKSYNHDLLIPAQKGAFENFAPPNAFDSFFEAITNSEESEYLREAVSCAKAGYMRAAIVLGWSAAIDRVHRRIEFLGFKRFNATSAQMATQQAGRYKKFNQAQNVNSLGEIREVFDNVILWILDGMKLIDNNQHTRLRSCFEMRCHCAHPGDAPITSYNLLSFFSDLDQIIFSSPNFTLQSPDQAS